MSNIALPYMQIIDPAIFKSVLNAKIYIGEYGTLPNPTNSATWKQAYFVQDDGTRVAASQPIRTNAAGFAVDGSGNIRTVQVDGQYSLLVQDSLSVQKFSNTRVFDLSMDVGRTADSIAELRAKPKTGTPKMFVFGYYVKGDGGGGEYWYDSTDTTSADNGGTIIAATDGGRWKLIIQSGIVSFGQFGAKTDGTDSTSFVQAALNAASSGAGFELVCLGEITCAGSVSLTGKNQITIRGVGSEGASKLKFTGSGTGNFIAFTSCTGIIFDRLNIVYTNEAYTGTLVRIFNSARITARDCSFVGVSVVSASILVDLDTSIEVDISRCEFSGASGLLRGQRDDGGGYANAVSIRASTFDRYVTSAIRNPGQSWSVQACAFENATNGAGFAITMNAGLQAMGFDFSSNWLGDAFINGAFTWIVISGGTGIRISNNYINGTGFNLASAIAFSGAVSGVDISSNRFSSLLTAIEFGTALVSDSSIEGNSYITVTNRSTGTLSANVSTQEEGNWTPDLRFGGLNTGVTYASRTGKYTKIGRVVYITFDLVLTNKGSATGAASLYGLPFVSRPEIGTSIDVGYYSNLTSAITFMNRVEDSNTILSFGQPSGTTVQPVNDTVFTNTTRIAGSGFYFV